MDHNEWDWWQETLYDYKTLKAMDQEQLNRLILSCLLFIVNALQPERLNPEDVIDNVCDSPNTTNK